MCVRVCVGGPFPPQWKKKPTIKLYLLMCAVEQLGELCFSSPLVFSIKALDLWLRTLGCSYLYQTAAK